MNPFVFVDWENVAEFFAALMWVLATIMAIVVIGLYLAPSSPTVSRRHGQPPVFVGR